MIYILYLLLLITCMSHVKDKKITVYKIVPPVVFALLIGLRHRTIGVDTPTYYEHFYIYGPDGAPFVERGFDIANQIFYAQGWGPNSLFLYCAVLSVLFIFLALQRYNNGYWFASVLLYTLPLSFFCNGMRQGIAVSIFLFASKFIEEKKIVWYVLFILLGMMFHTSILLLLPLYFIVRYSLNSKIYVIVYILSYSFLFFNVIDFIGGHEMAVLDKLDYSHYIENQNSSLRGEASTLGFVFTKIVEIVILSMMVRTNMFKQHPVIANFCILAFIVNNMGYNSPMVSRITIYFSYFRFMILPYIFTSSKSKILFGLDKKTSIAITYSLFFIILIHGWLSSANKLFPYLFYWE